jgi:omega-6 fatty acid desaturase (delta-12 desaturase)
MIYGFGLKAFLLIQIPIVLVGGTIGIWMFYIQHQFEDTHWERGEDWDREDAALYGSSFYDLPKPLMWITGNIGIHHIHHLSSRIPFYKLPHVLKEHPELGDVCRLSFMQSLKCVKYVLWDESQRRLVTFKRLRA